jgi:TRAP-type C4-dicarboxylate transport system substrate-binding protein
MRRLGIALATIAALWTGNAMAADPTVELKLAHWVPPAHPLHPALQAWAADLEAASGGTIKSTIFPAQQLGKAVDHYDMARDGIADFAYVNPGYQPGRFPVIAGG